MTITSTSTNTTTNRRIRRIAGRLALSAVAAGIIGAGPLAAVASADCPYNLPACPSGPALEEILEQPERIDLSTIDPDLLDDLVLDDGTPDLNGTPIDPDLLDDPILDPGTTPDLDGTPIDPDLLDDPILDPGTTPDPGTGDEPEGTTTTTTTTVPEVDDERATPVVEQDAEGELAFTGGSAVLALAGAGIVGVGALAVGGSALARRRQQG